jgi:hypothetical protein
VTKGNESPLLRVVDRLGGGGSVEFKILFGRINPPEDTSFLG